MSKGNPAFEEPVKVHAYLTVTVIQEAPDGLDISDYVPAYTPNAGDIITREDFPGTGTHQFTIEDGPVKWHVDGTYVASGVQSEDGTVLFDFGGTYILNMLKIGAAAEATMKQQIHDVLDHIKVLYDLEVANQTTNGLADPDAFAAKLDTLEKDLWRKH